jgi:hypothetical protein
MEIRYEVSKARLAGGQRAGAQDEAQQGFFWHTKKIGDFKVSYPLPVARRA